MNNLKNKLKTIEPPLDMLEGTIHKTKNNGLLKILNYKNARKVSVQFLGYKHIVSTRASEIRLGNIKNLMMPNVQGVGFIGIGKYSRAKDVKAYATWKSMFIRCYCPKSLAKHPTYKNCSVAGIWHNFQIFAEWFYNESNYCEGLCLDKDILLQGNKVYCPEKCVFVDTETNAAITSRHALRGVYKLGVHFDKSSGKFKAQCNTGSKKRTQIGYFSKEDNAHEAYKEHKYNYLRKLAENQTDSRVRKGLLSWKIPEY